LTGAGCAIWSAAFVLAGYLAGTGWERVATIAGRGTWLVAAVALGALLVASKSGGASVGRERS
jgi:membrane protein DedA with SNARE-associated domain